MTHGFFGKVLNVNLARGTLADETLAPALYRDFLGGYGLGCRVLYERMSARADPLGAENILGFVPGLLTGAGVPFSGRFMVVGKSPLTGGWGDANCGAHFGPVLRASGRDGVFISGIAPQPTYLLIDNARAELRDARHLWGLDTHATEQRLKTEFGRDAQVVSIGIGGEKLSLLAGIVTDGGRVAARSGLGAVMGSKRLKAIVVRGKARVPIYDARALSSATRAYAPLFKTASPLALFLFRASRLLVPLLRRFHLKLPSGTANTLVQIYRKYGTAAGTALSAEIGDAPVQNWRGVGSRDFPLDRALQISDDAVIARQSKQYNCRNCPVGCGGILRGRAESHKPEYETLTSVGTLLLNDDLDSIVAVNDLCNRHGLDTISVGATVAFAIECAERGLIESADLKWGNAAAIVELVEKIARREGIGAVLADGVKRAAERIGNGAAELAMHAGGQELPMHDPRYEPLLGLAYQADATPARHTTVNTALYDLEAFHDLLAAERITPPARYAVEGKGKLFAIMNQYVHVASSAGLCEFALMMGSPPIREWINAATGWNLDLQELLRIGARIQTLRHLFNLRAGVSPRDCALPARVRGNPPLDDGPLQGVTLDPDAMLRDYFRAMDWDEATGVPSRAAIEMLGVGEIAGDLGMRSGD